MKIEFLLLPEYGEQSERTNEQIPLFFPLLALPPCSGQNYIDFGILPAGRALRCGPGTLPGGHAGIQAVNSRSQPAA